MKRLINRVILFSFLSAVTLYGLTPKLYVQAHGGVMQFEGNATATLPQLIQGTNTTQLNLEFWYKPQNTSGNQKILNIGSDTYVYANLENQTFQIGSGGWDMWTSSGSLLLNEWNHVSIDFNGSTISPYINGVYSYGSATGAAPSTFDMNATEYFIGDTANTGSFLIDELRVWNISRDLTTDILLHKHLQLDGNETGLTAYYNFDERVGNNIKDITTNAYEGTIDKNIKRLNFLGSNLEFTGVQDSSNVVITSGIVGSNTDYLSYSVWVKIPSSATGIGTIVRSDNGHNLRLNEANLEWILHTGTFQTVISYDFSNYKDKWTHIAVTADLVNDNANLFLDGELVEQNSTVLAEALTNSQETLGIGSNGAGEALSSSYIAQLSVWDKALVQTHVEKIMLTSPDTNNPSLVGYWPLDEGIGDTAYDRQTSSQVNNGFISQGTNWVNTTAPNIYGDTIYTTEYIPVVTKIEAQDFSEPPSFILENNQSAPIEINGSVLYYFPTDTTPDVIRLSATAGAQTEELLVNLQSYDNPQIETLNISISDYNTSEYNLTGIVYYGVDGNDENFTLQGSQNITEADTNLSVPVYSPDGNFSLRFDINGSSYWYNFSTQDIHSNYQDTSLFKKSMRTFVQDITVDFSSVTLSYFLNPIESGDSFVLGTHYDDNITASIEIDSVIDGVDGNDTITLNTDLMYVTVIKNGENNYTIKDNDYQVEHNITNIENIAFFNTQSIPIETISKFFLETNTTSEVSLDMHTIEQGFDFGQTNSLVNYQQDQNSSYRLFMSNGVVIIEDMQKNTLQKLGKYNLNGANNFAYTIDSNNTFHGAFYSHMDNNGTNGNVVNYITNSQGKWDTYSLLDTFYTDNGNLLENGITIDTNSNNTIAIVYFDNQNNEYKKISFDSLDTYEQSFQIQVLEPALNEDPSDLIIHASYDNNDTLVVPIYSYTYSNRVFKVLKCNNSSCSSELIYNNPSGYPIKADHSSFVIDSNNSSMIIAPSQSSSSNYELLYYTDSNGSWQEVLTGLDVYAQSKIFSIIDKNDTVHIAYVYEVDTSSYEIRYASKESNGTFQLQGVSSTIESIPHIAGIELESDQIIISYQKASYDSNGNHIHQVTFEQNGITDTKLYEPYSFGLYPSVLFDGNTSIILHRDGVNNKTYLSRYDIYQRELNTSLIDNSFNDQDRLAITQDGKVHLMYQNSSDISYRYDVLGASENNISLQSSAHSISDIDMVVDSQDRVHLAFAYIDEWDDSLPNQEIHFGYSIYEEGTLISEVNLTKPQEYNSAYGMGVTTTLYTLGNDVYTGISDDNKYYLYKNGIYTNASFYLNSEATADIFMTQKDGNIAVFYAQGSMGSESYTISYRTFDGSNFSSESVLVQDAYGSPYAKEGIFTLSQNRYNNTFEIFYLQPPSDGAAILTGILSTNLTQLVPYNTQGSLFYLGYDSNSNRYLFGQDVNAESLVMWYDKTPLLPAQVSNLAVTYSDEPLKATITWDADTSLSESFTILRNDEVIATDIAVDTFEYIDTEIEYNTTYSYTVVSDNVYGSSTTSAQSSSPLEDTPPVLTMLGNLSLQEDFIEHNITLHATDQQYDSFYFSVSSSNSSIVEVNVTGDTLVLRSLPNIYGSLRIDYNVTQDSNSSLFDTGFFYVTVNNVNDTPTLSTISNISKDEDFEDFNITINPSDVDLDNLKLTVDMNDTSIISIPSNSTDWISSGTYNSGLTLPISAIANKYGTTELNVTVQDPSGEKAVETFTITVNSKDDAPVANSMAATVGPNSINTFDKFTPNFSDADGIYYPGMPFHDANGDYPIMLKIESLPSVGTFEEYNVSGDGNWSEITEANFTVAMNNLANFRFNAGDNGGTSTDVNWSIATSPNIDGSNMLWSNTATGVVTIIDPSSNNAPDVNITSNGADINGTIVSIDEDSKSDPIYITFSDDYTQAKFLVGIVDSNDTSKVSLNDGDINVTRIADDNVSVIITAKANTYGDVNITLGAFDGDKNGTKTFTLRINSINDTPSAFNFEKTINEDNNYSFSTLDPTSVYSDTNDSSQDNNELYPDIFQIVTLPQHGQLDLNDSTTALTADTNVSIADLSKLTYRPSENNNTDVSFTWRAYDGEVWTDIKTATFNINPVDDAPVFVNSFDNLVLEGNIIGTFIQLEGYSVDGKVLEYEVNTTNQDLISIDLSQSNMLTISPKEHVNGSAIVEVTVKDDTLSYFETFEVYVDTREYSINSYFSLPLQEYTIKENEYNQSTALQWSMDLFYFVQGYEKNSTEFLKISKNFLDSEIVTEYSFEINNTAIQSQENNHKTSTVSSNIRQVGEVFEVKYIKELNASALEDIYNLAFNQESKAYQLYQKQLVPQCSLSQEGLHNGTIEDFIAQTTYHSQQMQILGQNRLEPHKILLLDNQNSGEVLELDTTTQQIKNVGIWELSNQDICGETDAMVLSFDLNVSGYENKIFVQKDSQVYEASYIPQGYTSSVLALNDQALKAIANHYNYTTTPTLQKEITHQWTYLSLPSQMTLCTQQYQSLLSDICDQDYAIEEVFPQVDRVWKYTNSWSYYSHNLQVNYNANQLASINGNNGLLIESSNQTTLSLPFDILSFDIHKDTTLYTKGWHLVGNQLTQSPMQKLDTLSISSDKQILYMLKENSTVDGGWEVFNSDNQAVTILPELHIVEAMDAVWIYVQ